MRLDRELVLKAIEAGIMLEPSLDLMGVNCDLLNEESEESNRVENAIDCIFETRYKLIEMICEYTGVSENDFIGDGFYLLTDNIFGGNYTPEEVLAKFEEIDVSEKREWKIIHNLNYLVEFDDKIKRGIDVDRSREIFNVRFKLLLNETGIEEDKKVKYANALLDYVNGRKSREDVMRMYKFYIEG